MPSRWIEHVKEFAKKNNMSYGCALSDPNLKKGYVPAGDKKRKPEKLEMATPSTEPKPKNIVIKPRPTPTPAPKSAGGASAEKKVRAKNIKDLVRKRDGDSGKIYYANRYNDFPQIYQVKEGRWVEAGTEGDYGIADFYDEPKAVPANYKFFNDDGKELKLKNPAPALAPAPTPAPAQEDKTWTDRFKVGDEVLYTYPNSSTRYLAIVRKKTPKSVSIQLDDYDEEGQLLLWKRKFDKKKEVVKSEVRLKKKGDEMNTYSMSSDKDLLFKRGYMSRSDPNA